MVQHESATVTVGPSRALTQVPGAGPDVALLEAGTLRSNVPSAALAMTTIVSSAPSRVELT
jgi:hypothetical protein